jgi:hypothetical protein
MSDGRSSRLWLLLGERGTTNWDNKLNNNFNFIDSGYGNILSYVSNRPEVYQLAGAFADEPGAVISLPKSVDDPNAYTVAITPIARTAPIGDIWVEKGESGFTVHRSGTSADGFIATVYYEGAINGYGSAVYREWYVSPVIGDHSSASLERGLKWVLDRIGVNLSNVILPANCTYILDDSLTIPENVTLLPQPGVTIYIGSGATLTINGGFVAGPRQPVFDGDKTVLFGVGSVKTVHPEWFGAAGGATETEGIDDTLSLQKAMTAMPVSTTLALSAMHRISSSLTPRSNTEIAGVRGAGLVSKPSTAWSDTGLISTSDSVNNVAVRGITLNGNKANNPGGRCFGVLIKGSSMISVENCLLMSFPTGDPTGPGGDGVYVGRSSGGSIPQEIRVVHNTITANERQGISVTSVSGMLIEGNHITYTSGTNPGAGMDFEPNSDSDSIRDVRILGNRIAGNAGPGIMLYNGNDYVIDDIVVSDNCIRDNGSHGIHCYRTANGYVGSYSISGNIIRGNAGNGVFIDACKAHGMVVTGNTLWENGVSGVWVEDTKGFILNSNSICFNGADGVLVKHIYGSNNEGNISSNTIMNNGTSSADSYCGINFPGNDSHPDSRCLVSGNVIGNAYGAEYTPTQKYGVYMGGNADRIVLNGNWTFNHTTAGAYVPGYTFAPMGFNYDDGDGYFGTDQIGAVQTMSASAYIGSNVGLVLADATSGEVDPRLSPSHVGHRVTVVKTDASANKVVVRGQPSETVGGAEYFELFHQHDYVTCVFIGDSKWVITANK